nr:MAG TPA: hypothetical protein [Caudoviricetes sp.]
MNIFKCSSFNTKWRIFIPCLRVYLCFCHKVYEANSYIYILLKAQLLSTFFYELLLISQEIRLYHYPSYKDTLLFHCH